jgi:hypothetical protein
MRLSIISALGSLCLVSVPVVAQSVPAAVFSDPPADAAHPALQGIVINWLAGLN